MCSRNIVGIKEYMLEIFFNFKKEKHCMWRMLTTLAFPHMENYYFLERVLQ